MCVLLRLKKCWERGPQKCRVKGGGIAHEDVFITVIFAVLLMETYKT